MFKRWRSPTAWLLVDPVFANPAGYETPSSGWPRWRIRSRFTCDFSGYSDIALGTARLLGYRLAINFNMPFAATNITELWRRQRMSLSGWIRDYILHPPRRQSRLDRVRTVFNLLFAMTLCGLWHGANWTFVAWGALNGVYLIVHRAFRAATRDLTEVHTILQSLPGTIVRIAATFTAFTLAMVIFRSPTFATAATVFDRLFIPAAGAGSPVPVVTFWTLAGVVLAAHLLAARPEAWNMWYRLPAPVRGVALAGMLVATLVLVPVTTGMFIYFQF